ncbi:MAG: LL-diaminopimelate aminotransferase [Armatimonadetes bacterium]|nr:LL-diaminopimelate aminotransferase [Armatimonadota bacterium]
MSRAKRLDRIPPYLFGEIAAAKRKAFAEGMDVIDLGIGDPDRPTPSDIIEELDRAAHDPITHRYDESPAGEPVFLQAVADWYRKRFGVELDPGSEVLLLIGSKEGLAHTAWTFIDRGDISLVPDPAYTVYKVGTWLADGEVYPLPLRKENGFLPVLDEVAPEVANKAKLLWLNYPNNPTGAVANEAFYRQAVEFAHRYQLLIISDLAYSECAYDGYRPPSILQTEGAKEVAIELHSLSKMFNMTGWRIAMAVGNGEALSHLNKLKSNVDSKQFSAISRAAAYAIRHGDNSETIELYRHRRNILVAGLKSLGWPVEPPKATFYVWTPTPSGESSIAFAKRLLERAGVLVIPGIGYGNYGEGYVRMSLTVPGDQNGERLTEVVKRLEANVPYC